MTAPPTTPRLERLRAFFTAAGRMRCDGLDIGYFRDMSADEQQQAWRFLARMPLDKDSIKGLWLLDRPRAIAHFKAALAAPAENTPYPAVRQALQSQRLELLGYVSSAEPDLTYLQAMCRYADSEFPSVRAQFAHSVSPHRLVPEAVELLKRMILTEPDRAARGSAVMTFMAIHGKPYRVEDAGFRATYASLSCDDPGERQWAIDQLEKSSSPVYL